MENTMVKEILGEGLWMVGEAKRDGKRNSGYDLTLYATNKHRNSERNIGYAIFLSRTVARSLKLCEKPVTIYADLKTGKIVALSDQYGKSRIRGAGNITQATNITEQLLGLGFKYYKMVEDTDLMVVFEPVEGDNNEFE